MIPTVIGTEDNSTLISVPTCSSIEEPISIPNSPTCSTIVYDDDLISIPDLPTCSTITDDDNLVSIPDEKDDTDTVSEDELVSIPKDVAPPGTSSADEDGLFSIPKEANLSTVEDEDGLFSIPEIEDLLGGADVGDPDTHCTINATDNVQASDHWSCNNLTIEVGGILNMSTFNLTVNGAVGAAVINGTLNGGTGTHTFRNLRIDDDGTYNATTGTTWITGTGALSFDIQAGGTLTHNNGHVRVINQGSWMAIRIKSGDSLYDLSLANNNQQVLISQANLVIDNNLTIERGRLQSGGGEGSKTLTVTGHAYINDTLGSVQDSGARIFGNFTITSSGIVTATKGTTTVLGNTSVAGTIIGNKGIFNATDYNMTINAGGGIVSNFSMMNITGIALNGTLNLNPGSKLYFKDIANVGILSDSSGTFNATGNVTNPIIVASITSGKPSNYWYLSKHGASDVNITAIYTDLRYVHNIGSRYQTLDPKWYFNASNITGTNLLATTYGAVVQKFDDMWLNASSGSTLTLFGSWGSTFPTIMNNVRFANAGVTNQIYAGYSSHVEFNNSNFDITKVYISTEGGGGHIISLNTNDVANDYYIYTKIAGLDKSAITNDFSSEDNVTIYFGGLTIDETADAGNFSIKSGASANVTQGYNLTAAHNVIIYGWLDGGVANNHSFGSLTINSGGTYNATTGTTTVTDRTLLSGTFNANAGNLVLGKDYTANYALAGSGTFNGGSGTHTIGSISPASNKYNMSIGITTFTSAYSTHIMWAAAGTYWPTFNGDVIVNTANGFFRGVSPATFNNLTINSTGTIYFYSYPLGTIFDWTILGYLNVSSGTFSNKYSVDNSQNITVSGDVYVSGTLTGNGGELSFGSLTINSGGIYSATTNITNITNGSLINRGTFTHNSGTVEFSNNSYISGIDSTYPLNNVNISANTNVTTTFGNLTAEGDVIVYGTLDTHQNALSFDDTNDVVNISDSTSLSISDVITVEAWIKPTTLGTGHSSGYTGLVVKSTNNLWNDGYGLFYESDNYRFFVDVYTSDAVIANESSDFGNWVHLVGTFDGDTVRIYKDGVEGTLHSYSGSIGTTTNNLYIGAGAGSGSTPLYFYNGEIDEVRIYNRTLSATEVKEHYHNLFSNETGLVGYWPFDETSGQTTGDRSGLGNTGTLGTATEGDAAEPTWAISNVTLDSLDISHGGTYNATSGNTTITGINTLVRSIDDYGNAGTFTHNNGTVALTYGGSENLIMGGDHLYNLVITGGSHRWYYNTFIDNDLTVSGGTFNSFYDSAYNLDVTGTVSVSGTLNGRNTNLTLGSILVEDGGTYIATSGKTAFTKLSTNSSVIGNFSIRNGSVQNLRINSTLFNISGGANIEISNVNTWPAKPANTNNTGKYVNISNQTADGVGSSMLINISYVGVNLANPGNVSLYEYNDSWHRVPGASIDTTNHWVSKNVTYFSLFGLFEDEGEVLADGCNILVSKELTANLECETLNISSGIVLNASTYTINVTDLANISGGTLNGGTGTMTFNSLRISNAGTYNATSGTTNITGGNFINYGTFVHNSGTVEFANSSVIIGANNSYPFNDVLIDASTNVTIMSENVNATGDVIVDGLLDTHQNALEFDGSNDYVSISDYDALDITDLTIEAWVKPSTLGTDELILHRVNNYGINHGATGLAGGEKAGTFGMSIYGTSWRTVNSITSPQVGTWYHVVGTYDGTDLKIYINGVLENTTSPSIIIPAGSAGVDIGTYGPAAANWDFNGIIDEVRLYNASLSATDVKDHYHNFYANETNLVGYWPFDETSGTSTGERLGVGNAGTLTNNPVWTTANASFGSLKINSTGIYNATSSNTTISSEASSGFAIDNDGTWIHNNGLTKITAANTQVDLAATGNVYDLEIDTGSTFSFNLNSVIDNDFTVSSGTIATQSSLRKITVTGDVVVRDGASLGDALETNDWSFGSLTIHSGGTYSATTGDTIITGESPGNRDIENAGTFTHNNGNVSIECSTTTWTDLGGDAFYNVVYSTATHRTNDHILVENDFTLDSGTFEVDTTVSAKTIAVTGDIVVNGGTLRASNFEGNVTAGSMTINSGGTYQATSGNTTITSGTSAGTALDNDNGGTYTHNNGRLKFTDTSTHENAMFGTDSYYDVEVASGTKIVYLRLGNVTINNDLKVTTGTFRAHGGSPPNNITVIGDVVVEGTLGYAGWADAGRFGSLTINSGGTYQATSGITYVNGNFDNSGTFTHNNGKVSMNKATTMYTQSSGTVEPVFYDFDHSGAGYEDIQGNITVEHEYLYTGGNGVRISDGVKITLGSATASGTITHTNLFLPNSAGGTIHLYGASADYPGVWSGADMNWDRVAGTVRVKWLDYQVNAATGGNGVNVVFEDNMTIDRFDITNGDSLNITTAGIKVTIGTDIINRGNLTVIGEPDNPVILEDNRIYASYSGTPTIYWSYVNRSTSSHGFEIVVNPLSHTVTNSTFTSTSGAGVIIGAGKQLTITNSTISGVETSWSSQDFRIDAGAGMQCSNCTFETVGFQQTTGWLISKDHNRAAGNWTIYGTLNSTDPDAGYNSTDWTSSDNINVLDATAYSSYFATNLNATEDFTVGDTIINNGSTITGNDKTLNMGSLTINVGGIYSATSGTTTITSKDAGSYVWNNDGTFTHNNGNVRFQGVGSTIYIDSGADAFYDFDYADTYNVHLVSTNPLLIEHNLTVSSGTINTGVGQDNTIAVTNDATIIGKIIGNNANVTFGNLIIVSGGVYEATTTTTELTGTGNSSIIGNFSIKNGNIRNMRVNATMFNISGGANLEIHDVTVLPANPSNINVTNKYVNITNTSATSSALLNISYSGWTPTTSVYLYKYNDSWHKVAGSYEDTANDWVSKNVTYFSLFGLFENAVTLSESSLVNLNSSNQTSTLFNSSTVESIEMVQINISFSSDNNLDTWIFNYTANGTHSCALGNRQVDKCYNITNSFPYQWITFKKNANTTTFDPDEKSTGDGILWEEQGSGTDVNITLYIDEHYNPNVAKHYDAMYDYGDEKIQNATDQRITKNQEIKVELANYHNIPLTAVEYKLDMWIDQSSTPPNQPLFAHLCNSTYPEVNGTPESYSGCMLVAEKTAAQLTALNGKFRGLFTNNTVSDLGDIKFLILDTDVSNPNRFYAIRTYKTLNATHMQKWDYSDDSGATWSNLGDGYESTINLNWFDADTAFTYKFWSNDSAGAVQIVEGGFNWGFTTIEDLPPLSELTDPLPGDNISLPHTVTFVSSDPNVDELNVSLFLYNSDGSFNQTLITNMNQSNTSFLWDDTLSNGFYNLTFEACELNTGDLFCTSETHRIGIFDSCTIVNSTELAGPLSCTNLTIESFGELNSSTFNITASGDVAIHGDLNGGTGGHSFGSLTINSGGTYTATSGITTLNGGNFLINSGGKMSHNHGTFDFINSASRTITCSDICTFYDATVNATNIRNILAGNRVSVINELTISSGRYLTMYTANGNQELTMGNSSQAGTIKNSGNFRMNQAGIAGRYSKVTANSSAYPFIATGSDWDWDFGGLDMYVNLSYGDLQFDATTGGGGVTVVFEDNMTIDKFTVSAGDTLNITNPGTYVTSSSLIDVYGNLTVTGATNNPIVWRSTVYGFLFRGNSACAISEVNMSNIAYGVAFAGNPVNKIGTNDYHIKDSNIHISATGGGVGYAIGSTTANNANLTFYNVSLYGMDTAGDATDQDIRVAAGTRFQLENSTFSTVGFDGTSGWLISKNHNDIDHNWSIYGIINLESPESEFNSSIWTSSDDINILGANEYGSYVATAVNAAKNFTAGDTIINNGSTLTGDIYNLTFDSILIQSGGQYNATSGVSEIKSYSNFVYGGSTYTSFYAYSASALVNNNGTLRINLTTPANTRTYIQGADKFYNLESENTGYWNAIIGNITNNLTVYAGSLIYGTAAGNFNANGTVTIHDSASLNTSYTPLRSATFGSMIIENGGVYDATSETTYFIDSSKNSSIIGNFSLNSGDVINMQVNATMFNISGGSNLELHDVIDISADPGSYANLGKYVNITNTSATSSVLLNISYDGTSPIDENQISLMKYNTSWHKIKTASLDQTNNWISQNVTSFSIFAPFDFGAACSVDASTLLQDHLSCTTLNITATGELNSSTYNVTSTDTLNISGTMNAGTGEHNFGSLDINSGGTYNATTGITTITSEDPTNAFDCSAGTFTHNNGLLNITTPTNTNMKGGCTSGNIWNLEIATGGTTFIRNSNGLEIAGNVTVSSGEYDIYGYTTLIKGHASAITSGHLDANNIRLNIVGNLTVETDSNATTTSAGVTNVTGDVVIAGGYTGNTANDQFGSLTIPSGGYVKATSGITTITSKTAGSYAFDNDGTFTHNDGTVTITTAAFAFADLIGTSGNIYNLDINAGNIVYHLSNPTTIENNLTITAGTFQANADAARGLTVTGDVGVSGYLGRGGTETNDHSFGSLTVHSGGTYTATTGTTSITSNTSSGIAFDNDGTLTANSGLINITTNFNVTVDLNGTSGRLYDLEIATNGYNVTLLDDTYLDAGLNITSGVLDTNTSFGHILSVPNDVNITNNGTLHGRNSSNITFGSLTINSGGEYDATTGKTTLLGNTDVTGTVTGNKGGYNASSYNLTINSGGIISNISQLNITLIENTGQLNISPGSEILFTDAVAAGFGASSGNLFVLGNATHPVNITTTTKTTPTTYWDGQTTMDITADYSTFSYMDYFRNKGGTWDIDNSNFTYGAGYNVWFSAGTISSFTNNTLDNAVSSALATAITVTGLDNIVILNPASRDIVVADTKILEFTNSNFDITNIDTTASGIVTSSNHNDVTNAFYVVMAQSDTVLSDEFATDPGSSDDLYLQIESGGSTDGTFQLNAGSTYDSLTIGAATELDTNSGSNHALTVTNDVDVTGTLTGQASALTFGSLTVNSGATYDATSGITTITDENPWGYAFDIIHAIFTHNNGLVNITTQANTTIYTPGTTGSNFYDLEIATGTYNVSLLNHTIAEGGLNITSGVLDINDLTDYNLTVTGNAILDGKLYGRNSNNITFGSLLINTGGEYNATSNTTTITSESVGGYALDCDGTFTANKGITKLTPSSGTVLTDLTCTGNAYNLETDGAGDIAWTTEPTIDNNVTVAGSGTFYASNDNNRDLTVTGDVAVNSGTLGRGGTEANDHSFGSLTISSTGTYDATTSTTTITTNDLIVDGTFTHNSGDVTFNAGGFQNLSGAFTLNDITLSTANTRVEGIRPTIAGTITTPSNTNLIIDNYANVANYFRIWASSLTKSDITNDMSSTDNVTIETGTLLIDETANVGNLSIEQNTAVNITNNNLLNITNFTIVHGILNATSGDIDASLLETKSTGTFLAPTAGRDFLVANNLTIVGAFQNNNGTITFDGRNVSVQYFNLINDTAEINNISIAANTDVVFLNNTLITGNLPIVEGAVATLSGGNNITLHGNLNGVLQVKDGLIYSATYNGTIFSLNGSDVRISRIVTVPDDGKDVNSRTITVLRPLNITNTSNTAIMDLNISYPTGTSESSLSIAKHNGTWHTLISSTDTDKKLVSSENIQQFSIFALATSVQAPATPPSETVPGASSGGGGGLGVSPFLKQLDIKVIPGEIKEDVLLGKPGMATILVENTGDADVEIGLSLSDKLTGLATLSEDILFLKRGESKNFQIYLGPVYQPGAYFGKVMLTIAGKITEVPVMLEVESLSKLFDVMIDITPDYKVIAFGEPLKMQVTLLNVGPKDEKADVTLQYYVRDFEGNTYYTESETVAVGRQKSFPKTIMLPPTMQPGSYVVATELIYGNDFAVASGMFTLVSDRIPLIEYEDSLMKMIVVAFAIIILVVLRNRIIHIVGLIQSKLKGNKPNLRRKKRRLKRKR